MHVLINIPTNFYVLITTTFFCFTVGGRPGKVPEGSVSVGYTEDLRRDFFGYAVANVSWSKPQEGP